MGELRALTAEDFDFEKNKPLPDSKWRVKDCDGNTLLA